MLLLCSNIDKIDEAMDDIQDNIQMVTDASEALGRDLVPIDQVMNVHQCSIFDPSYVLCH